jgi:hypothetical protein
MGLSAASPCRAAALNYRTPASLYRPSARPLPAPAYPGHYLVRRVSNAGTFRFQTRQIFISDTLLQEDIALEETADGIWSILLLRPAGPAR